MTTRDQDARFEALLAECAERMRAGEDLTALLVGYPAEYREELAMLARVAAQVGALVHEPSRDFVVALESRMLTAVDEARAAERAGVWKRFARAWQRSSLVKFAAAVPVALLLLGGSGVAAAEASKGSLPGSPLYPVRQARERAELFLARDTEARVETHSHHVEARGLDLERAVDTTNATDAVDEVAVQALRSTQAMVDEALRLHAQGNERAPVRALLAIRALHQRLDRLEEDAAPRHRPIVLRLRRALREQEERLIAAVPAIERPRDVPPRDERLPLLPRPTDRQQAVPSTDRPVVTPTSDVRDQTAPRDAQATPAPTRPVQPPLTPVPTRSKG
jgi:hypothetical protein